MTFLEESVIEYISKSLGQWELGINKKTGLELDVLAANAGVISKGRLKTASWKTKIAVVPIIESCSNARLFANTVAAILKHMEFMSFVTDKSNVAGIQEAGNRDAGIIFMADKNTFIALNTTKNRMIENSEAAGRGYAAALEGAVGGVRDMPVIVLGGGKVGCGALTFLKQRGADVFVYDKDKKVMERLKKHGYKTIKNVTELSRFLLVVEATPEGSWISGDMLNSAAWIAAPGYPLGLDDNAAEQFKDRLIHDQLQLGVISMLAMAL